MTFIIAEIGVNHDGCYAMAEAIIHDCAQAGCDAVKYQAFHPILLADAGTKKYEMLKRLRLDAAELARLKKVADEAGIEWMCTAFSMQDATAVQEIGVKRHKIGSGQVKDLAFVEFVGQFGLPVILSNGLCTDHDIEAALKVLPDDTTLLSCFSIYPTPASAITMFDMHRLRKFGKKVGYSCHAGNPWPSIAAAALGAQVIECHVTLDRNAPGPDHSSSLEVGELAGWVREVRYAAAHGSPTP